MIKANCGDVIISIKDIYYGNDKYISSNFKYKIVNIRGSDQGIQIHLLDYSNNDVKQIHSYELEKFVNIEEFRDQKINIILNG